MKIICRAGSVVKSNNDFVGPMWKNPPKAKRIKKTKAAARGK